MAANFLALVLFFSLAMASFLESKGGDNEPFHEKRQLLFHSLLIVLLVIPVQTSIQIMMSLVGVTLYHCKCMRKVIPSLSSF